MAEESVIFYTGSAESTDWGDNDTDNDLQALMHAAADADARDNEEALLNQEPSTSSAVEEPASSTPSYFKSNEKKTDDVFRKRDSEGKRVKKKSDVVEVSRIKKFFSEEDTTSLPTAGHANVVAAHYNTLEDKGLDERLKSRIVYMRNFNNWIKSMLINEYLNQIKENMRHNSPIRVMDMCCGKGGDLLKWKKGNISHLICTDIASVSLDQCESRYKEMCSRSQRDRNAGRIYKSEFIPGDCTKFRLREKYSDPSMKLDLVSCQFAFHYSFESLPQAECMLQNAAECLQPGGFFIGTIPDANEILSRQRKNEKTFFGNDVYQINFQSETLPPPLFGAKYNFHLEGVVDCPEFLVHFNTFVKLAKKHGLQLVRKEKFADFYKRMNRDGSGLLQKMQSLETYPAMDNMALLGTNEYDYQHAKDYLKNKKEQKVGTLSKTEWEAVSLYLTFAFRKVKSTWDANGKPQYEFK